MESVNKNKKIIVFAILIFFISNLSFASVVVSDVEFHKNSQGNGRLLIKYSGALKVTPDLTLGQNLLQITLDEAKINGRIEKELNLTDKFMEGSLVAFQDDKQHVKVRLLVPFKTTELQKRSSVMVKEKEIILDFPLYYVSSNTEKKEKVVKENKNKNANNYDESFLDKLLSDRSLNQPKKENKVTIKTSPKIEELEEKLLKTDEVKSTFSSPGKDKIPFTNIKPHSENAISPLKYAGKFIGFLILVLALFFAIVHVFRKGVFAKGKLGFLNSTPLITTLSTTYIGPKRSLMLVKVYNQVFLLGLSEAGINILSEIEEVPGLLKAGEKGLTGNNFDSDLDVMDDLKNLEEKIKIKDNINISNENSNKFKKIKNIPQDKNKFAEELKKKVKGLRPMQ